MDIESLKADGAALSKVFIVVLYASFPRFFSFSLSLSLSGKKGNYHHRVLSVSLIERSFGVKLQEHDAKSQRCRTAGYSRRGLDPFIYLNIHTMPILR